MKNRIRIVVPVGINLLLLASLFSLGGCSDRGNSTSPAPDISVDLSFPQGAPRLNQTAELLCIVKTVISADNVTMKINLPDGLQLASGDLSAKFGSILRGDVRELKAIIKPVRVGNYTIEVLFSFVPKPGSGVRGGTAIHKIYVSVAENTAEWGIYPPWIKESPRTNPPGDRPVPPATPLDKK